MASDEFRYQLRHELEVWRTEGLIDNSQYEQLAERYQINNLDTVARNRFVMILLGLGSILIGLGVITFVAANWQELPRTAKVTLLLSLFIVVNIAGFYLWKRQNERQQRLGHGLLILGALILGANMGLMGQMFHISNPFYELLLAWGIGVVAMSYSLRLTSLGVLSIILIGCGYFGFLGNVVFTSSLFQETSWAALIGQHMPLLVGLIFIPLAYWCRSGWIFALAAIAIIFSLQINWLFALANFFTANSGGWVSAIALALPPALLWGYDDSLWIFGDFPLFSHRQSHNATGVSFQPIARNLALVYFSILFYSCSFYWFWEAFTDSTSTQQPTNLSFFALIDVVIFILLASFAWLRLVWLGTRSHRNRDLTTIVIGGFIAISALIVFWHINIAPISAVATFVFNALLFLLAAGLIREGLAHGQRRAFWGGMVLLTLRIINWFILSATGLLFKSLMFILCGVSVIAIGLWFERYVRTLSHTPNSRKAREQGNQRELR